MDLVVDLLVIFAEVVVVINASYFILRVDLNLRNVNMLILLKIYHLHIYL